MNTISYDNFFRLINALEGDGLGKDIDGNYFICNREQNGIYRDKPYTKPAHILIRTSGPRYKIEDAGKEVNLMIDPQGKFDFQQISQSKHKEEIDRLFDVIYQFVIGVNEKEISLPAVKFEMVVKFIQLIAPDFEINEIPVIFAAVQKAIESPNEAFTLCKEQLAERGITKPFSNLYQLILIDELINKKLIIELDWKVDVIECFYQLQILFASKGLKNSISVDTFNSVEDLIKGVNASLIGENQVVVGVDMDADNYLFALIPLENMTKICQVGNSIGLQIKSFG